MHDYARAVVTGRIVAGPYVRAACARHLRDLKSAARKGFRFDVASADHAIDFFERFLRLPDTTGDDGAPLPFILQPWQAFVIGSLFGWKWNATGWRRFQTAYIEIGKGNGKTPLCAGIGLYGLTMDGERAAEIYAAGKDRDQAAIMFRDAERMIECAPLLRSKVQRSVGNIAYAKTLSFFRPFSREQGGKSGPRPHMGLIDELHEHPSAEITSKMRAGKKGRRQPLFVEITNSGFDRTSICWQHHELSVRVLDGTVDDDAWFAYVCALDEGDDPLVDEACWPKANPNLGVSIRLDYLREQVKTARNIPAETNTVLRLNFCVWTQTNSRFYNMNDWHACSAAIADADLIGRPCFGGLDLGQSDDLAAFVLIWLLEDGRIAVRAYFWTPQAALEKFKNRPYEQWQRSGHLKVTEGNITDFDVVEDDVQALCLESGVVECRYDKRFAQQMALHLEGAGITMIDQPQGFQLNEPLRTLSDDVTDHRLCHGGDPIMAYQAGNMVVRHGRNKEIRPDKEKAGDKIDGQVALAMARAASISQALQTDSVYESSGLFTMGEN